MSDIERNKDVIISLVGLIDDPDCIESIRSVVSDIFINLEMERETKMRNEHALKVPSLADVPTSPLDSLYKNEEWLDETEAATSQDLLTL